ncbi:MAG: uracil phosphoribosyltransferase [Gammaproteobacteria bacterium]|nr:MAG: uracil phosphoribosyltransferase [Gammaproteobacteria bacterium]
MAIFEVNHPLIAHKMGLMREKDITVKDFRDLVAEVTMLLTYQATAELPTMSKTIECWSGDVEVQTMAQKQPTLVPILRAGLGMLTGAMQVLPCAKVSVVGLKRNEETLAAETYYENILTDIDERTAIIIDPMLATGGTLKATIDMLKRAGAKKIIGLFLVAAPEGIKVIEEHHSDVDLYFASIDECLNEQGYILPGLGDAGDKIFGTLT